MSSNRGAFFFVVLYILIACQDVNAMEAMPVQLFNCITKVVFPFIKLEKYLFCAMLILKWWVCEQKKRNYIFINVVSFIDLILAINYQIN